ncbi:hypothetical protein GDO86_002842 [Hymenochirus boettgeri]|uniref:Nuclear receptor interacting protein 1 n=1 Tax=Hymenochirus boettgeri TaxID=247094 RepID=A0A8T2K3Y8_9PIPI|nr:hypothetical protein GDO86_002842 [Hymenochirus boettgeri]
MTYGEELSSEMQQDSIVLTYLEGLLMHQAAGGSGTSVDKLSINHAKPEESFKISGNVFSNCQSNAPIRNNSPSQGSGVLHLKKARLLQSSEDWNAAKRRRLSDSIVGINGKNEALLAGMVENTPKNKQDSTLLASLLQSFSSRLQSVALSQQLKQSLKEQGLPLSQETTADEKNNQCYGIATNRLKTLLNKSRSKDKITENNMTGSEKISIQEKIAESGQSGMKTNETISCAARLQAVASMVEKRCSPTASPKPSVACSQLALLLSSEAHLQQYSREHAVKAQTASQLASERLAAMARLKESSEKDSPFQLSTNLPAALNSPARTTVPNGISTLANISPFPNPLSVPHSPLKTTGYKNSLEKNHVKPSPNNSLLLHLLKSQNAGSISKCNLQSDRLPVYEESATPTTTDDFSDNNPSLTEDDTSDDESSHSNCAPIDLSFKNRVDKPETLHTSSLDSLTETLLHNWDPKVDGLDISKDNKDSSLDSTLKPHQKVTLLQLLLGHKIEENPKIIVDHQGLQKPADLAMFSLPTQGHVSENTSMHNSPLNTLPLSSSTADSPVNLTQQTFPSKSAFTSYISSMQAERHTNPASKHLIELTRKKAFQNPVPLSKEKTQSTAAFSASKLLQNLAQCGKPPASPDEQRLPKKSVQNGKTLGLIDRLSSPLINNQSHTFEEGKAFSSPSTPIDTGFPGSEIENLLERRTVLQLLLGTPNKSKNEKNSKLTVKDKNKRDRVEKMADEQIVSVKIKSEPEDDYHTQHLRETGVQSPLGLPLPRFSRSSPEGIKSPLLTPQDFSVTRNGLLSRLLRQNDGYENDLDINNTNCEPRQIESKMPCTVPKKRKIHQTEAFESQVKFAKMSPSERGTKQYCTPQPLSEPVFLLEETHNSKTDMEPRCTQSSFYEGKDSNWARENKGFNVLKQLLLSENCIKDLSQHRNNTTVEEMVNRNKSHLIGNTEFVPPPLNALMGQNSHHISNSGQMAFQYSNSLKNSPHLPSRTEAGHMCPLPSEKGPVKWVITGNDKHDLGKESPRLTKTNPILYYMLQRGAHSSGSQELRDRSTWAESFLGTTTDVTLKRENVISKGTMPNCSGVMTPSTLTLNKTFHNSSGNKYGFFDRLTIKKEPE